MQNFQKNVQNVWRRLEPTSTTSRHLRADLSSAAACLMFTVELGPVHFSLFTIHYSGRTCSLFTIQLEPIRCSLLTWYLLSVFTVQLELVAARPSLFSWCLFAVQLVTVHCSAGTCSLFI